MRQAIRTRTRSRSTLDTAVGGTVERGDGAWLFDPAPHSITTGSFVLRATDGERDDGRAVIVVIDLTLRSARSR